MTVVCISLSLLTKRGRFNNGTLGIGERNYKVSKQMKVLIILKQKKLQFPYDLVFHIYTECVAPSNILAPCFP